MLQCSDLSRDWLHGTEVAGRRGLPLEPVNHPEWRCLIGYYLSCQKPSRASTSPHQSLSVHMLPVDRAVEHEATCYCYHYFWWHVLFRPKTPSTNVTSYSGTSADRKKICGFVKGEGVPCYFKFRKWRFLHFTYLTFELDTFKCSPPGAAKGKKATHRFNAAKSIISLYKYFYNMAVWLDLFVIMLMIYDV